MKNITKETYCLNSLIEFQIAAEIAFCIVLPFANAMDVASTPVFISYMHVVADPQENYECHVCIFSWGVQKSFYASS